MKARFEEFYAEESFEDGKKGVQVLIDNNQYTGFNFINNLSESYNSVFFTENVMYYGNEDLMQIIIKRTTANITNCRSTRLIRLSRTISSCSRRAIIILPRAARRASFASLRKAIIRIKQRESFLGTNT